MTDKAKNIKTWLITVKTSKTFQLALDAFSKTSLWFVTIKQYINIVAIMSLLSEATTTISLDNLKLVFETVKLSTKATVTVANSLIVVAVAKLTYKITATISNSLVLNLIPQLTSKASTTISLDNLKLVLTMVLATVNPLSVFDAETNLGTVNTNYPSLGDMDYTTL